MVNTKYWEVRFPMGNAQCSALLVVSTAFSGHGHWYTFYVIPMYVPSVAHVNLVLSRHAILETTRGTRMVVTFTVLSLTCYCLHGGWRDIATHRSLKSPSFVFIIVALVCSRFAKQSGCWTCRFYRYNGTSFAVPHVAGVAALVLSNWELDGGEIQAPAFALRWDILCSAKPLTSLQQR